MQGNNGRTWQYFYNRYEDLSYDEIMILLYEVKKLGKPEEILEVIYYVGESRLSSYLIERSIDEGLHFPIKNIDELCNEVTTDSAIRLIASLNSSFFRSSKLVYDVATELCDETNCSLLIEHAVEKGAVFSFEQIVELTACVNQIVADKIALSCNKKLKEDDIDELSNLSDDVYYQLIYRGENGTDEGYKTGWRNEKYWKRYYKENPKELKRDIEIVQKVVSDSRKRMSRFKKYRR